MLYYKSGEEMKKLLKRELFSFFLGIGICRYLGNKVDREKDYRNEISTAHEALLDQWMTLRDKKISIDRYLKDIGCKKAAIYGLGIIGNHLYEELVDSEVEIVGIDCSEIYNNFKMPIYKPNDIFHDVDLIIVTPLKYEVICQDLRKNYEGRIMPFHEVLRGCENYLY